MVGATGFEPVYGPGQDGNTAGTKPGHIDASACGQKSGEEHAGDISEQAGDAIANAPCCTYVADSDFATLIRAWQAAPQWAREVCTRVLKEAGKEDSRCQGTDE